jgi:hypothetical protein
MMGYGGSIEGMSMRYGSNEWTRQILMGRGYNGVDE